jgi:hypothetical protein
MLCSKGALQLHAIDDRLNKNMLLHEVLVIPFGAFYANCYEMFQIPKVKQMITITLQKTPILAIYNYWTAYESQLMQVTQTVNFQL